MTRLAIMSDLHIDLNHFGTFEKNCLLAVLKEEKIDHLHLAGDLANDFEQVARPFIDQLAKELTVTYHLGNHDMLHLPEETIDELDFQVYQIGQRKLLTFHGWYDYSFSQDSLTDITKLKRRFWFDRRLKRPLDDKALTQHSLLRLEECLQQLSGEDLIVSLHFVPHENFLMTHHRFRPFNAFLGSQSYHQLFRKYAVKDCVFGHAHRRYGNQTIDGVTYHSHPLGYKREWELTIDFVNQHPHYNPTGTWNLSKRYNVVRTKADFQAYYKEQLKKEFRSAMTIFDC